MLKLIISDFEEYDNEKMEFINTKGQIITIEHSLVSISKWESKWRKPFLSKEPKTIEQTLDYIRCMTITQNVSDKIYSIITNENIKTVSTYIEDPMTATWFTKIKGSASNEIITSEIIYYWMITYSIPFEYQKWHLNRLLALITVCNKKREKAKPMSNSEIMSKNTNLNNERRKRLNSEG